MDCNSTPLEHFFKSWELNMSTGNIPALIADFADVFMYARSQGTQSVRASDFALALPKRKQLFDKVRCQPTVLVSLIETKLDSCFTMAQTQWCMTFAKDESDPQQILVDSTYIVRTVNGVFKIVFYLVHQDIIEILNERGILHTRITP
jgi:hypothetical protein